MPRDLLNPTLVERPGRDLLAPPESEFPKNIGVEGLPEAIKETLPQYGELSKLAMGGYSAVDQAAMRLKQIFGGGLSPEDRAAIIANRAVLKESPSALAGNALMTILGLSKVAPTSMAGGTALGVGLGAAEPTLEGESTAKNMAMGGVGGITGQVAGKMLARAVQPEATGRIANIVKEGVTPTPGQALGGWAQRAEEGLTSVPLFGDAIKHGQRKAVEEFNRAAINRALTPVGKKLEGPVGREGVAKAGDILSKAYDDLLPKLRVQADQPFVQEINTVRQMAQSMHPQRAQQFEAILKNDVWRKFTPQGKMHPTTMKEVESKLGEHIRNYGSSADGDQRALANALKEVQSSIRRMVERGNPQYSGELAKINKGWANLVRVENAAGRMGSKDGIFSPEGLRGAVRATDKSARKRAFARGTALMEDLADEGVEVLGKTVPDSGTPFRSLMSAGMLGAPLGAAMSPLGLLYTKPGRQLATAVLARRPEAAANVAQGLRAIGSPAGAIAGPTILPQLYGSE